MAFHTLRLHLCHCTLGAWLALSLATTVRAQTPVPRVLTLAQALEAARNVNPEVQGARQAVAAAAARERQAGAYPNPAFSLAREQTSGRGGQRNAQNIAALEQSFEIGGIRSARVDAARLRREAAAMRLGALEAQVILETTRVYAAAVAAERRGELAVQGADAFSRAVGVSERRLAAGDVSGYAHRRIRLEAARYATMRAEALLARRNARLALAAMVSETPEAIAILDVTLADSLPLAVPEEIAGTGRPGFEVVPDSLVRLALASRPDLRALELEAAASRADAIGTARERMPSPAISLGFKNERIAGADGHATGFVAGISVPLPIWDRRAGAIAAADAEARRREAEVVAMRRRVVREVAEAYDSYASLRAQLDALAPQLGPETETALRAVQVAYAEGDVSVVEWLDAVRAFQEAETSYANLRAEALVRRAALQRAVGVALLTTSGRSGAGAPNKE